MGSGVTGLWGLRLHLLVLDFISRMYYFHAEKIIERVCRSPTSKEQIYVLCVKVVINKDFQSMERKCALQVLITASKTKITARN